MYAIDLERNQKILKIHSRKFIDRQPLYHLEQKFYSRYRLDISHSNMSRWVVESASPLIPLLNLMKEDITDYDIASMNATTLQVLDEAGRLATTKSYVYCFRGGGPKRESIIYEYNEKNHKAFVKGWFDGRRGQRKRMRFPSERRATDGEAGGG